MWCWLAVAAASVIGHLASAFLRLRGGKGVATGFGAAVAMWPLLTIPALTALLIWFVTLRATRYGDVLAPGTTAATDFTMTAKTLVDFEARFDITDRVRAGIGADNLTDEYPDANPAPLLNPSGTQSFNNYSPFGRSGRFIYGKLNYRF